MNPASFKSVACAVLLSFTATASAQWESSYAPQLNRTQIALTLAQADKGITNRGTQLVVNQVPPAYLQQSPGPTNFVLSGLDSGIRRIEVVTVTPSGLLWAPMTPYGQTNYLNRIVVVDDRVAGLGATNFLRFYTNPGSSLIILPLSALQHPVEVHQITIPSLR